jgi:UDPglucose--hexose-1-phosphate uridylyltransferase
VLCTTSEAELGDGHRVVVDHGDVLVVCPFWSGSPFEMLVIPRPHRAHVHSADPGSVLAAGKAVREALAKLHQTVGDVAYNLVFHSAPYRVDQAFHWHIHIVPKLSTRAGFELGTGVLVNVMPPEVAAQALRAATPSA